MGSSRSILFSFLISTTPLHAFTVPLAQQGGQGPLISCCSPLDPNAPCCIGQWDGAPYQPPISCGTPGGPACGSCMQDEIAHAALIPTGTWTIDGTPTSLAGMVLLWTKCDNRTGYTTYVWDPAYPGNVAFQPSITDKINAAGTEDGPFCAGHAWILDDSPSRNPKLLTVGGQDRDDLNPGTPDNASEDLRVRAPLSSYRYDFQHANRNIQKSYDSAVAHSCRLCSHSCTGSRATTFVDRGRASPRAPRRR